MEAAPRCQRLEGATGAGVCLFEALQLTSIDRIERALALFMVVAGVLPD